jgi:hypothetical protein
MHTCTWVVERNLESDLFFSNDVIDALLKRSH